MKIKWNVGNPPKEEEEYLVTTIHGHLYVAEWTNIGIFAENEDDWHWRSNNMYLNVVAWMPLPEPYIVRLL